MRIPEIKNLETAIRMYWEKIELRSSDIKVLFEGIGSAKATELKRQAQKLMNERNTPQWNASRVNTKVAYEAWGLDIEDLEKRYSKLKKLAI